ncbi:MAG: gliding motility protein GldD [Bacteroidales bacterium]|nr:gliding motility protein GldD [Bacteroidales bacterium]
MKFVKIIALFAVVLMSTGACRHQEVYMPKQRGYYRINIPDTGYQALSPEYPYFFEYSQYAYIDDYNLHDSAQYWINVAYPQLNAVIYISYRTFHGDSALNVMINDSRSMVFKQISKADDVIESVIRDDSARVYGKTYEIKGNEAACPFQMWMTDRNKHFFRASLYFGCKPNNDSLQPAIDYIGKDIMHMINTFKWTY